MVTHFLHFFGGGLRASLVPETARAGPNYLGPSFDVGQDRFRLATRLFLSVGKTWSGLSFSILVFFLPGHLPLASLLLLPCPAPLFCFSLSLHIYISLYVYLSMSISLYFYIYISLSISFSLSLQQRKLGAL